MQRFTNPSVVKDRPKNIFVGALSHEDGRARSFHNRGKRSEQTLKDVLHDVTVVGRSR